MAEDKILKKIKKYCGTYWQQNW